MFNRLRMLTLVLIAAGVASLSTFGEPGAKATGGREREQPVGPGPNLAEARFFGAAFCMTCHLQPTPQFRNATEFVQLDEYFTWRTEDKHSLAYLALLGERGREIGRRLQIDVLDPRESCLNCHAVNVPEARRGWQFNLRDGVSCDACHGPAQHWLGEHLQPEWREKTQKEKEALGMFDVRDPVKRAEMCLSCHVGNAAEGKVITHAMYAAGHPPLGSFEVARFSRSLPQHWRDRKDVPYFAKAAPAVQENYRYAFAGVEHALLVLAGAQAAPREALRYLADRTPTAQRNRARLAPALSAWPPPWFPTGDRLAPERVWPELAIGKKFGLPDSLEGRWPELALTHLDCASCHHELLRHPHNWRQQRRLIGPPGRPALAHWPFALIERDALPIAADCAADVRKAVADRPYGNPEAMHGAALQLAHQLHQVNPVAAVAVPALLQKLCTIGPDEFPDYDSARQIAWAVSVIYDERHPGPRPAGVARILDKLAEELNLDRRAGRTEPETNVPGGSPLGTSCTGRETRRLLIKEEVRKLARRDDLPDEDYPSALGGVGDEAVVEALARPEVLRQLDAIARREAEHAAETMRRYDPVVFKQRMAELRKLLDEPGAKATSGCSDKASGGRKPPECGGTVSDR